MNVYCLDSGISSVERLDSFTETMFNGLCYRTGDSRDVSLAGRPTMDNDYRVPLSIVRSGSRIPDVFICRANMVISQEVKELISGMPEMEFLQVWFEKLVDCPYQIGDGTWTERYGVIEGDEVLEMLDNVPEMHRTAPPYYEVIVHKVSDIQSKYGEGLTSVMLNSYDESAMISAEMLSENPIVWDCGYLYGEEVHQILNPYIDRDFLMERSCSI